MKRWFRPVAYFTIAVLAGLAIFGGGGSADANAPVTPRVHAPARLERSSDLPALLPREEAGFPSELFAADPAPPPPPPAPPAESAPPAEPEIKMLGWMMSESVPYVFVELGDTSYTLEPNEAVDDLYRFDGIGGGYADFTHLPTGEARRFAVSDPTLIE